MRPDQREQREAETRAEINRLELARPQVETGRTLSVAARRRRSKEIGQRIGWLTDQLRRGSFSTSA